MPGLSIFIHTHLKGMGDFFDMKRIISILLCVMCLTLLVACGADSKGDNTSTQLQNQQQNVSADTAGDSVDLNAIKYQIISDLSMEGTMDMDTAMLNSLYGIEEADVKDSACFATMEGVFPDEIIMVRAADSDAAGRIEEKLQTRLAAVLAQSKNYDAENYEIAQKCKVTVNGDVVALFVSSQHEAMQVIFDSAFAENL